jgi:DNA-binding transcriptional LysR family regulator
MDIDVRHLRYFVCAAEHLNLQRAAKALGIRRPTLSSAVREVEDRLGLSLFERDHHGVRLTTAGRNFLASVRRILCELDNALWLAARAANAEFGHLALGIFVSAMSMQFREFLAAHHRAYPDVSIWILEASDAELITALHERRIDVAIGSADLETDGVVALPLWREAVYVALAETHALARHPSFRWKDLEGQTVLVRSWEARPAVYRRMADRLPARAHIVEHVASREAVLAMVSAGFGVTLVSSASAGALYPGVVFRQLDERDATITVTAAWLARTDNPVQRKFIALLRDHAKRAASTMHAGGVSSPYREERVAVESLVPVASASAERLRDPTG